jgi:hypothetical protein
MRMGGMRSGAEALGASLRDLQFFEARVMIQVWTYDGTSSVKLLFCAGEEIKNLARSKPCGRSTTIQGLAGVKNNERRYCSGALAASGPTI